MSKKKNIKKTKRRRGREIEKRKCDWLEKNNNNINKYCLSILG